LVVKPCPWITIHTSICHWFWRFWWWTNSKIRRNRSNSMCYWLL